jgi:hypothetical protein
VCELSNVFRGDADLDPSLLAKYKKVLILLTEVASPIFFGNNAPQQVLDMTTHESMNIPKRQTKIGDEEVAILKIVMEFCCQSDRKWYL